MQIIKAANAGETGWEPFFDAFLQKVKPNSTFYVLKGCESTTRSVYEHAVDWFTRAGYEVEEALRKHGLDEFIPPSKVAEPEEVVLPPRRLASISFNWNGYPARGPLVDTITGHLSRIRNDITRVFHGGRLLRTKHDVHDFKFKDGRYTVTWYPCNSPQKSHLIFSSIRDDMERLGVRIDHYEVLECGSGGFLHYIVIFE